MKRLLILIAFALPFLAQSQVKISDLPTESTITDSTIFVCVKSAVTKKTYAVDLQTYLNVVNVWNKSGTDVYVTGVSVGIGTASPSFPLEVIGKTVLDSLVVDTIRFAQDNTIFKGDTIFIIGGDTLLLSNVAMSAGAWLNTGNYVYTTTTGDSVGVNTVTPDVPFDAEGETHIGDNDSMWVFIAGRAWCINGWNSVIIGEDAGAGISTGDNNVYIGVDAGELNVVGQGNVFIGRDAGDENTDSSNVFIGWLSGASNTNGEENTFVGRNSGSTGTTGSYNSFYGRSAGEDVEGDNNTMLGYEAGRSSTTADNNIYIGNGAGKSQTTADNLLLIDSEEFSSAANELDSSLIYGQCDNDSLILNADVRIKAGKKIGDGTYNDLVRYLIDPPHAALKYEDSTFTVALTQNNWVQATNTGSDIWQEIDVDADFFVRSNDTLYVQVAGHYLFMYNQGVAVGSNNNCAVRVNTDGGVVATMVGGSGIAGQYDGIPCGGYLIASAGEAVWVEIVNLTDNDDFDLISGNFVIWYLHP
ncbi:MAG: hypothetical protein GY861_26045 [bacterium]|nr:hypothetical protein [bacterium]